MFNLGLLSDAALTGLSDEEKNSLQKQATQQFLLGSLLSNDPSMGLKSAYSVPEQYLSGQKAITEMQEKRRQRGEVSNFLEEFAPNQQQAQGQALNANLGRPRMASSPYALGTALGLPQDRVEPQAINQPIDYDRALSASLRLSGNPAQPQIRETLSAMQPKFQGDLRVDASGNVLSGLPTMKDGVVSQYNPLTRGYASAPAQGYKESRILATPPEVSTNTELVPRPGGGFTQQPIFGAVESVGAIEAAKAQGQASGQVEQVIGADGRTYYVPRSSLLTQPPRAGGAGTTPPVGGVAGAVAKVSPSQATLDTAANDRFLAFSKSSLEAASGAGGRKAAAEQLYDLATQVNNNKLTGLQAGIASYMNAIPGVGKLFEQDITDVTRMTQLIKTAQLDKTAAQKGAASNFDAKTIGESYASITDPASSTRMAAAFEVALADKDIAQNQFVESYTGDPKKAMTAWQNSPDNKPLFNHPKFNQFLSEQVNTWVQRGAEGKPVLPAGFQFGTGKTSGSYLIKKPDGTIYRIGQ